MFRWMGALSVMAVITGLMAIGVFPTQAIGLVRTLMSVYVCLLAVSLGVAIIWL